MRRDVMNVAILWFVLTFVAELVLPSLYGFFPLAAAEEAVISDDSFHVLLVLGTPVFTFVVAMLAYSLIHFRANGAVLENGAPIHGNDWIAGVWLAITGGLCVIVIIYPGLTGLAQFQSNRNPDLTIKVVGRQWAWDISYPAHNIVGANEVVLPVNKRIKFEITAADVLHSFWIPAFRNKMDAVPGQVTAMYVTPTKIAGYEQNANLRVQCAEICGTGHAPMSIPVRILSQADFDAWIEEREKFMDDPVVRGATLAKSQGCTACHSTDGQTLVGPSWKNLYGNPVQFEDGATQIADTKYLGEYINRPDFKVIKGFQKGIMPATFAKTLTPEQIDDLVAYIKSLSDKGKAQTILVNLKDYTIETPVKSIKAGETTFRIKNVAASEVHEFIIVKTDLTGAQLPLKADDRVDEDKVDILGALEDIEAGDGGDLVVNLTPGRYLLLCNKGAHHKLGMYSEFTVTP